MSEQILRPLFESYTGQQLQEITELPASGSNRRYFRLKGGEFSLIGAIGTNLQENHSFIYLARHFKDNRLRVPTVLAVTEDESAYIQEDLGDQVLFGMVAQGRESGFYSSTERALLNRTIEQLPRIQFAGARDLDWKQCYPQEAFDARMVDFDLNYFKYCFLKATGLEFNEVLLQDDFERFKADLLKEEDNTFMYRDFQARNVMIKDGEPWFIDFQGGRRGPIYYDVASFIWQARSRFPEDLKQELIRTYLRALQT